MKALIYFILLLSVNSIYSQCPCLKTDLNKAVNDHDNIVIVELISKSRNTERFNKNNPIRKGLVNEFKVIQSLKGSLRTGDTIQSLTGNGITDNGFIFTFDDYYILFHESYIDTCSFTKLYSPSYQYEIKNIIENCIDCPPLLPLPPPFYSSSLHKFETQYLTGLEAELINSNKDSTIAEFENILHEANISKQSLIQVHLNKFGEVSSGRIIDTKGNQKINDIPELVLNFINMEMKFKTKEETCLIENSNWSFYYN